MIKILLLILIIINQSAAAEPITFDLDNLGSSSKIIQMISLITILSLAPSILMMVTSFTRIVIVLSFLRSAIGLQQSPPNSILISLALFLSLFIMSPTFELAYKDGIEPLMEERINEKEALIKIVEPFKAFMLKHTRTKDIELFLSIKHQTPYNDLKDIALTVLMPAFMISELKRAFEIGFLLFIPFLIIDILISSILMAMGMMMLPPVTISLPFKLIFFVIIDGWYLLCGSLVKSFGV